ncbi:hypothetical protein [Halostagnicola bangensis]
MEVGADRTSPPTDASSFIERDEEARTTNDSDAAVYERWSES